MLRQARAHTLRHDTNRSTTTLEDLPGDAARRSSTQQLTALVISTGKYLDGSAHIADIAIHDGVCTAGTASGACSSEYGDGGRWRDYCYGPPYVLSLCTALLWWLAHGQGCIGFTQDNELHSHNSALFGDEEPKAVAPCVCPLDLHLPFPPQGIIAGGGVVEEIWE